ADYQDSLRQYDVVKTAIQQAFIDAGGTLSHHHGVGTDHAPWMEQDLSPAGVDLMVGLLRSADPNRNLNPGTLIPGHREWSPRAFSCSGTAGHSTSRIAQVRAARAGMGRGRRDCCG